QQVDRGKTGAIWLFSQETLDAIPALYKEVNLVSVENVFPVFLTEHKIAQVPLFQWLLVLAGMPAIYLLTGLVDRLVSPLADRWWHRLRNRSDSKRVHVAPIPVRLLILTIVIHWMVANLNLSL